MMGDGTAAFAPVAAAEGRLSTIHATVTIPVKTTRLNIRDVALRTFTRERISGTKYAHSGRKRRRNRKFHTQPLPICASFGPCIITGECPAEMFNHWLTAVSFGIVIA